MSSGAVPHPEKKGKWTHVAEVVVEPGFLLDVDLVGDED